MTDGTAGNLQKVAKAFYVGTPQCLKSGKNMFSDDVTKLKN